MASITPRKRADGSVSYNCRIRIKRAGQIIYEESETFEQRKLAEKWGRKREAHIDAVGVESLLGVMSVGAAVQRYIDEVSSMPKGLGRSKLAALNYMIKQPALAGLALVGHSSGQLMDWVRARSDAGAAPATVAQDVVYLKQVFEYARSAWSQPVDLAMLEDVRKLSIKHGLLDRSEARERRPSLDELDRLFSYFERPLTGKGMYALNRPAVPMVDFVLFQIFSARRAAETCRIRWDDLDEENRRVLVRDMKHPRKKIGNNKWVHLPPRAWAIVQAQPRTDERIFPVNERSVGALFQRAVRHMDVAIEDLRLHDLRHEGTSHYFELGLDIPRVGMVTGHGSWDNLKRYMHLTSAEPVDKYKGWVWLERFG